MEIPDVERLADAVRCRGARAAADGEHRLRISGISEQALGDAAAADAIRIYELVKDTDSLEETYLEAVAGETS